MPSPQHPIDSGFGAASTTGDVITGIDLAGRTAIVTGGHSGLGLETTRALRAAGATVVVACRFPDRARDMLGSIDGVEIGRLDLMDPASIDAFTDKFLATDRPLDILVNSAAVQNVPLTRDARVRGTVRHQPSGTLPAHHAAVPCPSQGGRCAGGHGLGLGASPVAGGLR
jgi:NADP-dependent 3-hydroxy acid dehydrogenase YdfG